MTTGYRVGATDLDSLFKARSSAAIANTGFLSNGGVDLAQRFEPRAGTPAVANTNFVAPAGDLAQLFMGINATSSHSINSGQNGPNYGFSDGTNGMSMPGTSASPLTVGANTFAALMSTTTAGIVDYVSIKGASAPPANNNATWNKVEVTGIFSDSGSTQTKTLTRGTMSYSTNGNTASWTINPGWRFVPGTYSAVFYYG